MSRRIVFCVPEEEVDNVDKFLNEHAHRGDYKGAIGGGISYTFTPTGIGPIVTVRCSRCKVEIEASGNL